MYKCEELLEEMELVMGEIGHEDGQAWAKEAFGTAESIVSTVLEKKRETDRQIQAMENIIQGMNKWVRN